MSIPYYEDDWVTLYHGDALEILPELDHADAVITDPPYNYGFNYGDGYDDSKAPAEYVAWCKQWFTICRIKADRVIVFPGNGNLPVWWEIEKPSGVGCWHKPGNPKGGGVFQFSEWEPWLLWGRGVGGSDVIRATVNRQLDTGNHPCPKPQPLMQALIMRTKAESVIDPFVGSGTTVVAAKYLGVRAVGIEQNEAFCEIAAKRLAQDTLFGGAA